jgi:hypothetical protein
MNEYFFVAIIDNKEVDGDITANNFFGAVDAVFALGAVTILQLEGPDCN